MLLRAIADLDASDGTISLNGEDKDFIAAPEWRKRVRYFAAEPGWWADTPAEHFHDPVWLKTNMGRLDLDPGLAVRSTAQLSTGERQRLALLRAMEDNPSVLLADEPTAALDAEASKKAEQLLRAFLKEGGILVLVTHSEKQAKAFGTQRLKLKMPVAAEAAA